MFRVTSRLSIVILTCILIVNGSFLQSLFLQNAKLKSYIKAKSLLILLFVYLVFTLFEFYVPVSTFDTSKVPLVYEYLSKIEGQTSFIFTGSNGNKGYYKGPLIIAEYPGGRSEDIFWITVHHKGLINPRMYKNYEFAFDSEKFTKELITEQGLAKAREYKVYYIVFHKDRESKEGDEEFFRKFLEVEKDFGNVILFRF